MGGLRTQWKMSSLNMLREWKMDFNKDITDGALCPCLTAELPAKIFCSSPVHTLQQLESIWHLQTHGALEEQMWLAGATEAVIVSACTLHRGAAVTRC